jgi:hypothetical protein
MEHERFDQQPERALVGDHPTIPPAMPEVRDLSNEEYDQTYASGTGGHPLPPEVLAELDDDEPGEHGG